MLIRQEDDIRGRAVIGLDGDVVGSVHDVVLDDGDEQRFLVVGSRGFLGIGRHAFLVPIEAITSITEEYVFVGETSLRMLSGVPYDPSLDIDDDYFASIYRYYRVPRPSDQRGLAYAGAEDDDGSRLLQIVSGEIDVPRE